LNDEFVHRCVSHLDDGLKFFSMAWPIKKPPVSEAETGGFFYEGLDVIVQMEFVGMGAKPYRVHFIFRFIGHPLVDDILCEHIAF